MSKNKKTVFINGALGKMGQSVISACKSNSDLEVKYAVDVPVHPYLDDSIYSERDMKKYKLKDIKYSKAPSKLDVDLIIDFSSPKSSISLAKKAEGFRVPFVTGTTGFNSRQINELKKMAPTILDVTHSVQKPNQTSGVTGGNPEYIESLARAGIVNGVDGIFIETHTDPSRAKSDGENMLDVNKLEDLLTNLLAIREATSKL